MMDDNTLKKPPNPNPSPPSHLTKPHWVLYPPPHTHFYLCVADTVLPMLADGRVGKET